MAMSWDAGIMVSTGDDGALHFVIRSRGEDNLSALKGVAELYGRLTEGKEVFVRAVPAARSEQNFDTKEWRHEGFARFSLTGRDLSSEEAA